MVSQSKVWADFELIDRQSVLVNEDGSKDELQPELAQALQAALGPMPKPAMRTFLRDVLADVGIADMADLDGTTITEIVQGILN